MRFTSVQVTLKLTALNTAGLPCTPTVRWALADVQASALAVPEALHPDPDPRGRDALSTLRAARWLLTHHEIARTAAARGLSAHTYARPATITLPGVRRTPGGRENRLLGTVSLPPVAGVPEAAKPGAAGARGGDLAAAGHLLV
jgi:hypothetical protein